MNMGVAWQTNITKNIRFLHVYIYVNKSPIQFTKLTNNNIIPPSTNVSSPCT
jgi:hypothetical protein